jgi:hypothetical protein
VGVYLGRSPSHFRSVALILDINTGLVSPQFHIKLDPLFQTVRGDTQQESHKSLWQIKSGFVLQKEASTVNKKRPRPTGRLKMGDPPEDVDDLVRIPGIVQPPLPLPPKAPGEIEDTLNVPTAPQRETTSPQREIAQPQREGETPTIEASVGAEEQDSSTSRRSRRKTSTLKRLIEVMAVQVLAATSHDVPGEIFCCSTLCQVENTNVWDQDPLYAFKTHSDPDTMYMHQAMRQPYKDNFVTAMKEEIHSQVEGGVYSIIHESERPTEATLLPSVWQMRRKRNVITGDIKMYKARLNIDGS